MSRIGVRSCAGGALRHSKGISLGTQLQRDSRLSCEVRFNEFNLNVVLVGVPMKIVIYSDSFFPAVGGTERVTLSLARGLSSWEPTDRFQGSFCVSVVTNSRGDEVEDRKLPFAVIRRPSLATLIRLLGSADIVHLAGPALLPLAIGVLLRKVILIEHHGFQVVCPNGQLFYTPEERFCEGRYMMRKYGDCFQCNRIQEGAMRSARMLVLTPIRRWLSMRAALHITPTTWLASVIRLSDMRTIHHGLPGTTEVARGVSVGSAVAFQGRLVSTKGVEILLQAANLLLDQGITFCLKIIGDGPERHALEALAKRLGSNVEFLGQVPDGELEAALSGVSVVVVPSLAGEVFGLVPAENMLRGKAVIASSLGSLAEIVGQAGVIVPAGDPSALAEAIRKLLSNPSSASSLGSAARERAESMFSLRGMIQGHVAAYMELLRRKPPCERP
jgi:glycosyltransferase involved in cell wall biosynthesis